MANRIAIIGGSVGAAQAAFTLAEMGIEVSLITRNTALGIENSSGHVITASINENPSIWPLLVRSATHPFITLYTNSETKIISSKKGKHAIRIIKHPRYILNESCTSCGRCDVECSVKIISQINGKKITHSAIHAPAANTNTVPSAFYIEKNGIAPCRAACPLGINVQGFVSLLSKGKVDEALGLITDVAPLGGVLGRVCTHPCENSCKRGEIDKPVFIQALHRYAADNAPGGINYKLRPNAKPRREKIAIIGSGPAGLTAAWELARRGYRPTIFESHAVVGGMLATGIPRFRLPREVREREIEAIKALGVDIKSGVTVGKDVSISDLKDRGYRAFFLAIGAHENRKLNIPGEDLEGVVDAVSLLLALNLKVGASVGANVVVIGGGNSAIDSARTARKRSKGVVRILYRRTAEEMTAVKEETEDTLKEGITIDYLTQPIEILGDGYKVTGIRCQRMELGEPDIDGRRKPVPIPGSEFEIEADHVVIAIGQRPNSSVFRSLRLATDEEEGTFKVDPLTLETSTPGIFAGGDCVTGPNNVVEAAADGLKAAESIDRYLRGRDLKKQRTFEKPQPIDIDVKETNPSRQKRAQMPVIPYYKRKGNFEETHLGLPSEISEREAGRCLNCASCSECLECEQVCQLHAIVHNDQIEEEDIIADVVIDFTPAGNDTSDMSENVGRYHNKQGIYEVEKLENEDMEAELARASLIALDAISELKARESQHLATTVIHPSSIIDYGSGSEESNLNDQLYTGVFLCNCGGSTSSIIDFKYLIKQISNIKNVYTVQEIAQACSRKGSDKIATEAKGYNLNRIVLAACRCCNLDQICFSCTEKRVMCQKNLARNIAEIPTEFVNIREQCAKFYGDNPLQATQNALDIVISGIARTVKYNITPHKIQPVKSGVLIIGSGLRGLAAARELARLKHSLTVVSGPIDDSTEKERPDYAETRAIFTGHLQNTNTAVYSWPDVIELKGTSGDYEITLRYRHKTSKINSGALIVDTGGLYGEVPPSTTSISTENLLGRIIERSAVSSNKDICISRPSAIRETAGIFILPPNGVESIEQQILKGAAIAARVSCYLYQSTIIPRQAAISIDKKLCRGCGNCAVICPYIEMVKDNTHARIASVDQALCLGCGACITQCPTGAITQAVQSDNQIISTLEVLLAEKSLTQSAYKEREDEVLGTI